MSPHDDACEREIRARLDAMRAAMNDTRGSVRVNVEDFSSSPYRTGGTPWTASVSIDGGTRLREAIHSYACFYARTAREATDQLLAYLDARFEARRVQVAAELANVRASAEAWEAGVPAWSK